VESFLYFHVAGLHSPCLAINIKLLARVMHYNLSTLQSTIFSLGAVVFFSRLRGQEIAKAGSI
jgi:hypothetical protein